MIVVAQLRECESMVSASTRSSRLLLVAVLALALMHAARLGPVAQWGLAVFRFRKGR